MSIQIPNLHTSNRTRVDADPIATVFIARRKDATHSGLFTVRGNLAFNPTTDVYPSGSMLIRVDLSDSVSGAFTVKTVEQLDTTGKHTPTAYGTGRCSFQPSSDRDREAIGCRYWIMLVDNKREKE